MKNIQLFIFISIISIVFVACTSEVPKTRVYFQKKSPLNYLELRGDKSILVHQEKINLIGTYEADSSLVTLIFFGGRALRLEIKGDTLIDEEGNSWIYWSKGESGWTYEKSDGVKRSRAIIETQQNKDAVINDLNNLTANGYQYRIRPTSMGGGGGSYLGYQIPPKMAANENAAYTCIAASDTLNFTAISSANRKNGIKVQVDSDGRLMHWQYYGDFKQIDN